MSSFGVLSTGFVQKTLQDVLDAIETSQVATFGAAINTQADSVLGQLNGIFGAEIAELWALAAAIYRAQYPDSAGDESLDNVAAITGVTRLPATKSDVTLDRLNLDGGTQLFAGRVVSDGAGQRFVTTAFVENTNAFPVTASVAAESEEFGPVFAASETINKIETPVTGWSANAAVTSSNAETYALSDGQTLILKVDGGSDQTATFNTGDFADIANALAVEVASVISTDITGLTATDAGGSVRIESDLDGPGSSIEFTGGTARVTLGYNLEKIEGLNSLDTDPLGTNLETDAAFRLRRELLLRAQGDATVPSIRADVSEVEGVDDVIVFENDTNVTDGDGRPPKSVEVVILGNDPDTALDQLVADQIFESKGAGIETFRVGGATGRTETVTDEQGFDHTIKFNRATKIDIWIEIDVDVEAENYPGDATLQAALVLRGETDFGISDDVIFERIKCEAFDVAGVFDITGFRIGTSASPVGAANIPIGVREIADFDTSRVLVASTPV